MIQKTLKDIGLSEKEVSVYLDLLQCGREVPVGDLYRKSVLPRTTLYDVLTTLSEKGLVKESMLGKKKSYQVETPHYLYSFLEGQSAHIERNKLELKKQMNILEQMQHPKMPVPTLRTFSGVDGIKQMWNIQIENSKQQDKTLSIMCNNFFFTNFQEYLRAKSKELAPQGYSVKVLIHSDEDDPIFIKIQNFEVKATKQTYMFAAGMHILGNFVGYWTEMDSLVGTLLENQQIAHMQKALFTQVWQQME